MATEAAPATAADDVFTRHLHAFAADRPALAILSAGFVTAPDLGTAQLAGRGVAVKLTCVDDDQAVTRAVTAGMPADQCTVGDLRAVPLPPRTFDLVHCSLLLERIQHAELVLDRLIAALKPGGLLLLRFCDRDSAAGFLDRTLPMAIRRAVWRQHRPGLPGPHPAVYERLVSGRGIQAYALLRGLVISERRALGGLAGGLPVSPRGYLGMQKALAWMTHGRLTAAHEDLLYVMRKPENRYARVL